jgi:CheY-like chemotaxis protein
VSSGLFLAPALKKVRNFVGNFIGRDLSHSFAATEILPHTIPDQIKKVRRTLERRKKVCVARQMSDNIASSLASAMRVERRTILLVEDEVLIRMMLADELRGRGFNVVEAQNADEALTLLQSRVPVGLVLTDVQLPGSMDGIGLARLLRATRPELKVVIASGNISCAPGGDITHAFFRKPYAPDHIVKCIESLLTSP